ncbi:helix-turn-helix domain-containing protein [Galbibacter sp. PAP.153]|uniref:helix-turn-helix domain-containing protein n=1 Tax=Galbibacter sp. PAP.153 TaxID=3104623 RepID=UPI00300BA8FA
MKNALLILLFLLRMQGYCQENISVANMHLTDSSYDALFDSIRNFNDGNPVQLRYLEAFLDKAKNEHNITETVNGYKNYLHHGKQNLRLLYADSMILTATHAKDTVLIGSSYLTKGIVYYNLKQHDRALDLYLKANSFLFNSSNSYLRNKIKYHIAMAKYFLGYFDEAVSLLQQCALFFKNSDSRPYLNTLHCLGLCYNRMHNYGITSKINELGLKEAKRLANHSMDAYFSHSEGINLYFKKQYKESLRLLTESVKTPAIIKDSANLSSAYFYIAKDYLDLNQVQTAVKYLIKVDCIYKRTGYLRPDLRETYEFLIAYYNSKSEPGKKDFYKDRLIEFDRRINKYYRYLAYKIHKEYDFKNLLREKQKVERQLFIEKNGEKLLEMALVTIIVLLIFTVIRYLYLKRKYQKRFGELMSDDQKLPLKKASKPVLKKQSFQLSPKTEVKLLKKLKVFEDKKQYLPEDVNSPKVAHDFDTNTKYLSQLIMKHRGMTFQEYVNSLKIAHLIKLLKTDKKLRNYTYDALAKEVGFTTTPRFAAAFKANTDITAAYFIKELDKKKDNSFSDIHS